AFVVARAELRDGAMHVIEVEEPLSAVALGPWDQAGLAEFSGTVRYHFALPIAEEFASSRLVLDLGGVEYAASVYVNGAHVGDLLWPPYRVRLTGAPLRPGHNELVVEVSNTLAAQVLKEDNVRLAQERGWDNPYFRKTLPWHREALGGGLLGPIRLWAELS
ncbi:MAG: hypothetical protein J7M26_05620, partial [Armatimonadetes bacterium]|nr:hypothetical protein [Armatimonadota bacterium]